MRVLRALEEPPGIAHAPEVPLGAPRPCGQFVVLARRSLLSISRPIAESVLAVGAVLVTGRWLSTTRIARSGRTEPAATGDRS
jgi:hypothetical protein